MQERSVLRVEVDAMPQPGLLRPAIEAALSGLAWSDGPEAEVARVVRDAVRERSRRAEPC